VQFQHNHSWACLLHLSLHSDENDTINFVKLSKIFILQKLESEGAVPHVVTDLVKSYSPLACVDFTQYVALPWL